MIEVKLVTVMGDYVTTALIPPFLKMPEVLLWGSRVFVRETDEQYKEGLCVAVLHTKREG